MLTVPPAAETAIDVDALNAMFEHVHPSKIIEWGIAQFGDDVAMTSSFGAEAMVTIHLVTRVKPDVKIIFIDTGFLFPETLRFMEQMRQRFNLNVWTYHTLHDPVRYLRSVGITDPDH